MVIAPTLLAGSNEIRSYKGIGYGGVDTEGEREADSRRHGVWDDDEEEEQRNTW